NYDGLATVLDSAFTVPDLATGAESTATAVRFVPSSTNAKLALLLYDGYGLRLSQTLDLGYPAAPQAPHAVGGILAVQLTWAGVAAVDLAGYNLYRATAAGGPYVRVSTTPTGPAAAAADGGL